MAIVNASNMTPQQIIGRAAQALVNHRQALQVLNDLYAWTSGITPADLTAAPIGMPAADAQALLTAIADARAEYLIHTTGLPPGTYPQPGSAYVYAASQNALIGPS